MNSISSEEREVTTKLRNNRSSRKGDEVPKKPDHSQNSGWSAPGGKSVTVHMDAAAHDDDVLAARDLYFTKTGSKFDPSNHTKEAEDAYLTCLREVKSQRL